MRGEMDPACELTSTLRAGTPCVPEQQQGTLIVEHLIVRSRI